MPQVTTAIPVPLIRPCAQPAAVIIGLGIFGLFVLPGAWKILALATVPWAMGKSLNCLQ